METTALPRSLGMHPDYLDWPDEIIFVERSGVTWFLCTDGTNFVNLESPNLLIPAEPCVICGMPSLPDFRTCPTCWRTKRPCAQCGDRCPNPAMTAMTKCSVLVNFIRWNRRHTPPQQKEAGQ